MVVNLPVVSRWHCTIVYHANSNDYEVVDRSSNGTFVDGMDGKAGVFCNGVAVKGRCVLHNRDRITIGDCQLAFVEAGDVW